MDSLIKSGLCKIKSMAWNERVLYCLENYPEFAIGKMGQAAGAVSEISPSRNKRCFACRRVEKKSMFIYNFSGYSYDRRNLVKKIAADPYEYDSNDSTTSSESSSSDSEIEASNGHNPQPKIPSTNAKLGKHCHFRTVLYHELYHFKFKLYSRILEISEDKDLKSVKLGKSRRKQLSDRLRMNWIRGKFRALEDLLSRAESIEEDLKNLRFSQG